MSLGPRGPAGASGAQAALGLARGVYLKLGSRRPRAACLCKPGNTRGDRGGTGGGRPGRGQGRGQEAGAASRRGRALAPGAPVPRDPDMTGLEQDPEFDFDFLFEFDQSGGGAAAAGGSGGGRRAPAPRRGPEFAEVAGARPNLAAVGTPGRRPVRPGASDGDQVTAGRKEAGGHLWGEPATLTRPGTSWHQSTRPRERARPSFQEALTRGEAVSGAGLGPRSSGTDGQRRCQRAVGSRPF